MNLQKSLVAGIIVLSSLLILVLASCKTFTRPNAESIMHNIEIAKELYCSETLEEKRLEMLGKVREQFPWYPESGFICPESITPEGLKTEKPAL